MSSGRYARTNSSAGRYAELGRRNEAIREFEKVKYWVRRIRIRFITWPVLIPKLSDFFDCCSVFGQRGETSLVSVYRPAEMIRVWAAERENDFGRVLLPI